MKKSIKKSWPYFALALLVMLIAMSLDGYVTIKIMRIVDAAMAVDMDLFKQEAIKAFGVVAILLPINILSTYTKGLFLLKSLVKTKGDYVERYR